MLNAKVLEEDSKERIAIHHTVTIAVQTVFMTTGCHPMSAAVAVCKEAMNLLACADPEATSDLVDAIRNQIDTRNEDIDAIAEREKKIVGRLVSAYERQTAEGEG